MTFTVNSRLSVKALDRNENLIVDTQFDVYDPVLHKGTVYQSLNSLCNVNSANLPTISTCQGENCSLTV